MLIWELQSSSCKPGYSQKHFQDLDVIILENEVLTYFVEVFWETKECQKRKAVYDLLIIKMSKTS